MNKNMIPYYLSRAVISVGFGILLYATGTPLWSAVLIGALILAFFLWAPHNGRYAVHPELGAAALRRDERTQPINDQAARNAFVVSMLAVAAIAIYSGATGASSVSSSVFGYLLIIGALTYYASDFWLRKA